MRLSEELGVSEEEKTEITNLLAMYMKRLPAKMLEDKSAAVLASWWIRHVRKPHWIEVRIASSLEFVAGICDFIERYRREVGKMEDRADYAPSLKSFSNELKEFTRDEMNELLADIELAKTGKTDVLAIQRLTDEEVWKLFDHYLHMDSFPNLWRHID